SPSIRWAMSPRGTCTWRWFATGRSGWREASSVLRSLKSRIRATMALLILLVLLIAIIGYNAIGAQNRAAGSELALVVEGGELSTSLVGTTATEIRAAEQYLVRPDSSLVREFIAAGDSGYALLARYRDMA